MDLFSKAHASADTDAERDAIHHTLGKGPNQAAQGNHDHHKDIADALLAYYLKTDVNSKFLPGLNQLNNINAAMLPNDPGLPVGHSIFYSNSVASGWPNTNGVGFTVKPLATGGRAMQLFMDLNSNVWLRNAASTGLTWSAWFQINGDAGWTTTGLVQVAAAPVDIPFLGGVVNTQKARIRNGVVELRLVTTANTGTLTGNASGNYTNLVVASGLPSQYLPTNSKTIPGRLNDVPVSVLVDTLGQVNLLGGPPNVAFPASSVFACDGTWMLG